MQSILLFRSDDQPFAEDAILRIVRTVPGFKDVQVHLPPSAIQADFVDGTDSTIINLSGDFQTLNLSRITDASLRAALIFQNYSHVPLRIIDMDYTFDLVLSHYKTVAELRAAIAHAAGWEQ